MTPMDTKEILTSTQEQAAVAWIDWLNQLRLNELLKKLSTQDINLEQALRELDQLKKTLAEDLIGRNRGGTKGLHGFIAEATEAAIENARRLIVGAAPNCEWLDDNGSVDLRRNGVPIQQKFVAAGGKFSLNAIKEHLEKYPDFIQKGGIYQIPKDHYQTICKLLSLTEEEAKKLPGKGNGDINYAKWKMVRSFFSDGSIPIDKIEPAVPGYDDVQVGKIGDTIQNEKAGLEKTDQMARRKAYEASKPSAKEGVKAAKGTAALEGGLAFGLGVHKKLKEGKKLAEFTADDWADVGVDTATGGLKGGIRGAIVYAMTNYTATPAAVANALVTAVFGVAGQANRLRQGAIDEEDFLINAQVLCLDVSVSAVASVLGAVLIPNHILGAVIGNTVGMFLYGIAKDKLSIREQRLIEEFNCQMDELNRRLDQRYRALIEQLEREFAKFSSMLELAFDPDVNIAFDSSIALADHVGVPAGQVLRTKSDIDNYFTN